MKRLRDKDKTKGKERIKMQEEKEREEIEEIGDTKGGRKGVEERGGGEEKGRKGN